MRYTDWDGEEAGRESLEVTLSGEVLGMFDREAGREWHRDRGEVAAGLVRAGLAARSGERGPVSGVFVECDYDLLCSIEAHLAMQGERDVGRAILEGFLRDAGPDAFAHVKEPYGEDEVSDVLAGAGDALAGARAMWLDPYSAGTHHLALAYEPDGDGAGFDPLSVVRLLEEPASVRPADVVGPRERGWHLVWERRG